MGLLPGNKCTFNGFEIFEQKKLQFSVLPKIGKAIRSTISGDEASRIMIFVAIAFAGAG